MPVADPDAGRTFVCLVSGFLLASVAIGGGFLVAYLTLPSSAETTLFMYVGMILVCIPWCFWILTCMYRCMSRMTGLRIVCGDIDTSVGVSSHKFGGNAGGGSKTERATSRSVSHKNGNNVVDLSENNNHMHDVVVLDEQEGDGRVIRRGSMNDMSFASHESEMPLAKSMAS